MITKGRDKAIYCALLLGLVRLAALPLIALRLFGCLFFALTGWPLAPALVLIALLVVSARPFRGRPLVTALLVATYLASVLFHGWADAQLRLREGQNVIFDVLEAAIIVALAACSLVSRRRQVG
ncbi:hypothetical protein GJ697_17265 [Pseudoduganella sp. FT25W]|uniref:DUF2069 domain-containing protein n=1 Tax=Duganella alba TaxID=2666081 RepID=A0A6L5QJV8_9BURK|nr:hypothetical protein [Duganella alba]MRX09592.1 hypothetical protein [Duganella alba]MRX18365.1 hypothetical protein [Duganella alba]